MIAVSLKDGEELVDLFLRKEADVNAKSASFPSDPRHFHTQKCLDFSGQTALHFTASKNNLDIARRLLDAKPAASARVKDKRGQYAIHRAAAVGSAPMVELLLKNKSPVNAADIAGQTPLHHAVAEGHGDTAVALLKAGAETDKKDVDGFLALELAPDNQVCYTSLSQSSALKR
jgi:26S proteasome non-ATPase regulatory subunit 10